MGVYYGGLLWTKINLLQSHRFSNLLLSFCNRSCFIIEFLQSSFLQSSFLQSSFCNRVFYNRVFAIEFLQSSILQSSFCNWVFAIEFLQPSCFTIECLKSSFAIDFFLQSIFCNRVLAIEFLQSIFANQCLSSFCNRLFFFIRFFAIDFALSLSFAHTYYLFKHWEYGPNSGCGREQHGWGTGLWTSEEAGWRYWCAELAAQSARSNKQQENRGRQAWSVTPYLNKYNNYIKRRAYGR